MRAAILIISALLAGCSSTSASDNVNDDVSTCGACPADTVCVAGECEVIPSECPCPKETYCDLATNSCTVGCLDHDRCDTGRVCNVATRTCFNGCLIDDECSFGTICEQYACVEGCRTSGGCEGDAVCVDSYCQAGCDQSSDCEVSGSSCVGHSCACQQGEAICSGACTRLDTINDCGACGAACDDGFSCSNNECYCAPGVCSPMVLHDAGTGVIRNNIRFDNSFVYWLQVDGATHSFKRQPKSGGPTTTIHSTTDKVEGFDISFEYLIYTAEGSQWSDGRLWRVLIADGSRTQIDSSAGDFWKGEVEADVSRVYWNAGGEHHSVAISSGSSSTFAEYIGLSAPYELTNDGLFFASHHGCQSNCETVIYRQQGNLRSLHRRYTSESIGSLTVDQDYVYYSINTGSTDIMRVPIEGGEPTLFVTSPNGPFNLDDDATHLYWRAGWTLKKIYRRAKAGGEVEEVMFGDYVSLDGAYLYVIRGSRLLRLAK